MNLSYGLRILFCCMRNENVMHWDDPEGWSGEGGGRRVQDGEHMYNFFLIKIEKKKKKMSCSSNFLLSSVDEQYIFQH